MNHPSSSEISLARKPQPRHSIFMGRIESFSDGVIAVIITIMVLDLHPPEQATFQAYRAVLPTILIYALSFFLIASMWVNHHSLLRAARSPEPAYVWSNINLLFWMSLAPFVTATVGRHPQAVSSVSVYGLVFCLISFSFWILQGALAIQNRADEVQRAAFTRMRAKALISTGAYLLSAAAAFFFLPLSYIILAGVVLAYAIPSMFSGKEQIN